VAGRSSAGSIVVCDAGPLIHLDELKCLNLLDIYSRVMVPERVWFEVQRYRASALRRKTITLVRVDSIPDPSEHLLLLLEESPLDMGEEQALRLMPEFPDATLLTDDAAARLVAHQLGYDVHGTVGVILQALPQGKRTKTQVLNLLRAIPKRSSLFIRADLLDAIINNVLNTPG
jgi:predicted nucleic acid-binding protein